MRVVQRYVRKPDAAGIRLPEGTPEAIMTLDQRRRSRQRLTLSTGEAIGLALERGVTLHDGDVLLPDDEQHIVVRAAHEQVLRVTAQTPQDLARAAYHLGNRHVLLEVGADYLQLEADPVLSDMLQRLGGVQTHLVSAPFDPEVGAYGGGHKHGHDDTFDEDYALAQAAYHAHHHER